jgi:hypothetical protein
MSRSGTSLTTELIGRMGLDLGPEDRMLPPVAADNARGYWEQAAVYELNENIMAAFGGTWEAPPELPQGWAQDSRLDALRRWAAIQLLELFGPMPRRRALKDPRFAMTLPFWRPLIGEADHVICFRHPADVAHSLDIRNRHDLDAAGSIDLWLYYTRLALDTTAGERRLLMPYESYFSDTDAALARLADFVCGPGTADDPALMESLRECVDPGLWHNRDGGHQDIDGPAVPAGALEFYAGLLREAGLDRERGAVTSGARADR